jgi:hypothetical protein
MATLTLVLVNPDDLGMETPVPPPIFEGICQDFLDVLVKETPVDTGNCRDSWEMTVTDLETTFFNSAEYSSFLDEGWSQQSPDGMSAPAQDALPNIIQDWVVA